MRYSFIFYNSITNFFPLSFNKTKPFYVLMKLIQWLFEFFFLLSSVGKFSSLKTIFYFILIFLKFLYFGFFWWFLWSSLLTLLFFGSYVHCFFSSFGCGVFFMFGEMSFFFVLFIFSIFLIFYFSCEYLIFLKYINI